MCGIAGIYGPKASQSLLNNMLDVQKHRGPDHTGTYTEPDIAMGHNRLAIIDLSSRAHQPFRDTSKRYYIVFNGEIYNYIELKETLDYPFETASDTEVLLAAYITWGKECLEKFNGMFSFAIWDSQEKKLFAARDRFGVKPFYYHKTAEGFIFASEIKSIHATGVPKKAHKKVWANYLCYGSYGMPDETFWEDIHQLPGGHYLEFDGVNFHISRWYFFEKSVKKLPQITDYQTAKKQYITLLKDSIRLRFRADVPVGFNISGGLDSSALLAMVNEHHATEKINAYTFYTDNELYDELPWATEIIAHTGHPLHAVLLTAAEVPSLAIQMHAIQDEPYGGIPTLAYARIFEQARKDSVLVLLDGQGMDEQWAGYDYYFRDANEHTIQGVRSSPFKTNVLTREILDHASKPIYPNYFKDTLLNKQYRDLFYTKIPRALRFNDRASMASGTELREPFLDHRLVEFAFVLPAAFKIKEGTQKYMLRDIVSETLSDNIAYAPKRPLQTPQREWLTGSLKNFAERVISDIKDSPYATWFETEKLDEEWKNYISGDNDSSFHIWQWLSIGFMVNSTLTV